ncbi:MAG: hypothetical protein ACRC8S_07710, partial [Fimbriiglobus sp.]
KWYEAATGSYTEAECEEMLNRWDQYAREDAERYSRPGFDLGTGEWDRSAESGESGESGIGSGGSGESGLGSGGSGLGSGDPESGDGSGDESP